MLISQTSSVDIFISFLSMDVADKSISSTKQKPLHCSLCLKSIYHSRCPSFLSQLNEFIYEDHPQLPTVDTLLLSFSLSCCSQGQLEQPLLPPLKPHHGLYLSPAPSPAPPAWSSAGSGWGCSGCSTTCSCCDWAPRTACSRCH